MIARRWRGVTAAANADAYVDYLNRTGVPDYRATPGNRGGLLLRHVTDTEAVFEIITLWDSMEAIRAFAGDDVERARYYPQDDDFLLEREPTVDHFEVKARW
jgi:heme-degrading monooxygenase HmoA